VRVLVLLNRGAGAIQHKGDHAASEAVLSAFAQRGIDAEAQVRPGGELAAAARSAVQMAKQNELDAVVAAGGDSWHVPAPRVTPLDTTGAGDALVGALAARLASGSGLAEAVEAGVAVGTATAGRLGAEPVVPPEATGGRSGPPGRGDAL